MTNGKKLDLGTKHWESFKKLRDVRDRDYHGKNQTLLVTHQEMVDVINLHRFGISNIMFNLHVLFDERVNTEIIRGCFAPDVIVSEADG